MNYSYCPIDLGFDPRAQNMPVDLPQNATSIDLEVNGEVKNFTGNRNILIQAMTLAGFEVKY